MTSTSKTIGKTPSGAEIVKRDPTPEEASALRKLYEAWDELCALGWQDPLYKPKDELFEVIELGSTGIHIGTRFAEDEPGRAWVLDGDAWPSRPIMIRRQKR